MRAYQNSREVWALPACNPGGNLEFTFGGGHDGETSTNDYVFQAKTIFRPLLPNEWGWGLAAGTVRHPEINPGPNRSGNTYVYMPLSASFNDDKLIVHANAGGLEDRASSMHNMTWGIGCEFKVTSRLLAISEIFGDNRNQPYVHLGGRFSIIPDLLQVDATVGQPFDGLSSGRWISFGLRLTPERLF